MLKISKDCDSLHSISEKCFPEFSSAICFLSYGYKTGYSPRYLDSKKICLKLKIIQQKKL